MGEIVGLLVTIFFTVLAGLLLWKIFDMVRGTIKGKRKREFEESFEHMAQAFIQHRKDTERRLTNIEAIIAQESEQKVESKLNEPLLEDIEIKNGGNKMKNVPDESSNRKQKTK